MNDAWTDKCPIVGACLQQLERRIEDESKELSSHAEDVLRYIRWRVTEISADPEMVRLRGFTAIEKMLGILDLIAKVYMRHGRDQLVSFQLVKRSWGGLTVALDAIKELLEDVALDETELKMAGIGTTEDWKGSLGVFTSRRFGQETSSALMAKAAPVKRLRALCPLIVNSIHALRPYLRNSNVSVRVIGTSLANSLVLTHPPYQMEASLYTLRDLVEVRL